MITLHRHPTGFTLIELLIYLGLYMILITVITNIFATILEARTETTGVGVVSVEGERILQRIRYDVQRSTTVLQPPTIGSSGPVLEVLQGATTITYSLSPTDDLMITKNGVDTPLTSQSRVESFSVTHQGNSGGKPIVTITVALQSRNQFANQEADKTYQMTVGTR